MLNKLKELLFKLLPKRKETEMVYKKKGGGKKPPKKY